MTNVLYLLTLCLPLATVLIIFAMRYLSRVSQAKARLANEGAYRQIAETATTAQSQTATTLAEVLTRLTAIEKALKDVG